MRFRRGMAEEKGDEEEAAREEGENEKVRGRSWTDRFGCYDKYYADLQSRNVIILVDVSSVRRVRNFEKYLHRFYRGNYFSCDNVNGECLEN